MNDPLFHPVEPVSSSRAKEGRSDGRGVHLAVASCVAVNHRFAHIRSARASSQLCNAGQGYANLSHITSVPFHFLEVVIPVSSMANKEPGYHPKFEIKEVYCESGSSKDAYSTVEGGGGGIEGYPCRHHSHMVSMRAAHVRAV